MSYAQLCLLAVFGQQVVYLQTDEYERGLRFRETTFQGVGPVDESVAGLLFEVRDLYQQRLLGPQGGGAARFGSTRLAPARMYLQGAGAVLFSLMGLRDLNSPDTQEIARLLADDPDGAAHRRATNPP